MTKRKQTKMVTNNQKQKLTNFAVILIALLLKCGVSVSASDATCYSVEQHFPKRCKEVTCENHKLGTQEQWETYEECCGTGTQGGISWDGQECQALLQDCTCFVYANTGGIQESCVATSDPKICGRGWTTYATAESCCDRFAESSTATKCVESALKSAQGLGCPVDEGAKGMYNV